jgi:hypothetical protein
VATKKKTSAKKKTAAKKKAAAKKPAASKSRSSEAKADLVYSDVRRQLRSQLLGRLR